MTATANYLAFDLGASSGRAMLGTFDGARLKLEEIHRFENGPVCLRGHLYWDALRLFEHIKTGIGRCTQRGLKLDAIGIDTWGVDFGLLDGSGDLLATPRHYRDGRHRAGMIRALERVPRAEIYARTGIQFLPFNSLYQLAALAAEPARPLDHAEKLLFMPDLLTYWLTGAARTERSIASTSQMLNPRTGRWNLELVDRLDIPVRILPSIEHTGSVAGPLSEDVAREVGQGGTPVIYTAGHDTAAAVAAVPALPTTAAGPSPTNWAYISSGTWSLVGVELSDPLITPETLAADFTNEAGVGGTTRLLRNVAGLWLVQECQRTWAAQGQSFSHEELLRLAAAAPPLRALVDPDDPRFAEPGDMAGRIRAVCQESGQPVPESPGAVVRCALESLALKYRLVLGTLERLIGCSIKVVHVVGGGSRNELLNQLTADATGRPVVAGPVEATAAGNALVQALAQRRVGSPAELRQVVAASFDLKRYEPRASSNAQGLGHSAWDEALERFERLLH